MTYVIYGFENLADGDDVTSASSGFFSSTNVTGGSGTLKARTASAIENAKGCRASITTASTYAYADKIGLNVPALSLGYRFFQPASPTSGQYRLIAINDTTGAAILRLDLNSDNRLLVRNSAGTTITAASLATGAGAPAGTEWVWQVYIAPSGGVLKSVLTRLDTSAVRDSGNLTGQALGSNNVDGYRIGLQLSGFPAGYVFDFDTMAYETAPTANQIISVDEPVPTTPVIVVTTAGMYYVVDVRSSLAPGGSPSYTIAHTSGPDYVSGVLEPNDGLFFIPIDEAATSTYTITLTSDGDTDTYIATVEPAGGVVVPTPVVRGPLTMIDGVIQ